MLRPIVGALTIGQSPRSDVVPELQNMIGPDVEFVEAGALDDLTLEEVARVAPRPGDTVLVTRMRDGTAVKVTDAFVKPRLEQKIEYLASRGASIIALLCTGDFPDLNIPAANQGKAPALIAPGRILFHMVSAVAGQSPLGVIMPDESQIPEAEVKWRRASHNVFVTAASPYGDRQALLDAARKLRCLGAGLIVMDCIGFTLGMKSIVRRETGVPVILARSALARVLEELLAC